jgi:ribosomal protein L40E
MVDITKSEDLMVLFGVHPSTTNVDAVIKEVHKMFSIKQQIDATDRFNFIAFEANGPLYYEDFLFEPDYIIDALKDMKESLVPANISGGIMVAITFIIDVFKLVGGKCFRLIVIVDRSAPPIANLEVIQSLMNNVLDFPFFIDFVLINFTDPRQELKLMRWAKKNKGEVYFAKSAKEIGKALQSLSEKKEIRKTEGDKYYITPENEPFFANLADDLWVVDESELDNRRCQICGDPKGELIKCPKCDPVVHGDCMAQWAKMSNIGIPQVFRCMNCYNLLRLPKDFVMDVQSGKYKRPIEVKAVDQTELLRQKESSIKPKLKQGQDPLAGMPAEDDGWGDNNYIMQNDADLEIQFCLQCGALNFPESIKCSKCGHNLRE